MLWSLLAWERGLKLYILRGTKQQKEVAPCVGAWIEIQNVYLNDNETFVAPCVGAWIEIIDYQVKINQDIVAPCVGAWIEIILPYCEEYRGERRSLRGSVD